MMNAMLWLFGGVGLGWGLTELFDSARGRRRARIRDKAISAAHSLDALDATSRDVGNRSRAEPRPPRRQLQD
jgi:hypothetical protein